MVFVGLNHVAALVIVFRTYDICKIKLNVFAGLHLNVFMIHLVSPSVVLLQSYEGSSSCRF